MPFSISSLPPPSSSSSENMLQETKRTPLGVKSVGGSGSISARSSPCAGRPVLGEKRSVTALSSTSIPGDEEDEPIKPRFPTATVNTNAISDTMAARLATCLLGHVLFLKNQVPFPVAQLIRMHSRSQTSGDEPVPNKKLEKLLASFDLLSSHLGTTFSALSSALSCKYDPPRPTETLAAPRLEKEKVHFAILLGPSATATHAMRARVLLELDGLCVRVASRSRVAAHPSLRGDRRPLTGSSRLKENEWAAPTRLRDTSRESRMRCRQPRGPFECVALGDNTDSDASSDREDGEDDEFDSQAPPNSDSDSDVSFDIDDDSEVGSDEGSDESDDSSSPSDEETERDLCTAERFLSRALATANADPELGMSAEIRPTQIHILIRAPRRFSHPAWKPRQEILRDMDRLLSVFEEDHGDTPSSFSGSRKDRSTEVLHDVTNASPESKTKTENVKGLRSKKMETKRKGPGGVKTDYVRVCSRSSSDTDRSVARVDESPVRNDDGEDSDAKDEEDEGAGHDDDMIWWSWDGKLEGFTDL